jgi:hypothetical protein
VVTNQGSGSASSLWDWWEDGIYLSTSPVFDTNATLLTEVDVYDTTVAAGGSYAWTNSVSLPQEPAGTYYLFVVVDYQSQVYESTKTNNTSAALALAPVTPDLAPVSVSAPAAGTVGQSVSVTCVVTNQGLGSASGTWYDGIYFSSNSVFGANATRLPGVGGNHNVAAGSSYAWTNSVTLPQVPAGTYYLFVVVDYQSQVYESTKANNTSAALPLPVLPPPPPVITCPGNITVTGCLSGVVVNYTAPTVSGGCPPITTNCVPSSGSVFPIGTTTVNCSVTDSCGQSASCSFTIGDALLITPATGFTASGCVGGPFTTNSESFLLTNAGTASLNWSLANTSSWLNASPGGGTLAVGGSTNVTVSLSSNAYSLTSGVYTATVWFTNLNDSFVQSRQFTSVVVSPVFISNFNPPIQTSSGNAFVTNNTITFSVSSFCSTIASSNVQILLNGTNASATFTGNDTNWTVGVSVPANQLLTLVVTATAADGSSNSVTESFDTFSQNNFMIEAEDFDFNGGQFITNPIPTGAYPPGAGNNTPPASYAYAAVNSYFFYPEGNSDNAAIVGVDLTTVTTDAAETFIYRPAESAGTQVATDFLRGKFYVTNGDSTVTIFSDFNLGYWDPGQWVNYTRTFPTNTYNVYGRLASGGAYSGLSLSLVTSGVGTPTQTTRLLGTFSDPNANGWQAWDWVPLLNTNGQLAVVSLGGTNTLQANNTTAGNVNANFYMLVPAVVAPQAVHLSVLRTGSTISIQFQTQSGVNYTVLYSGSLNPANWQTLTTINGDGTVKTATDTMGSSPRFYRVSFQ